MTGYEPVAFSGCNVRIVTHWSQSPEEVASGLGTDLVSGLSVAEASARLERDGPNELQEAPPVPKWKRMLEQFTDPLVLLLLAAILVSLVVWAVDDSEEWPLEAIVIGLIVVLNAIIGYWQESRAIRAVESLRAMSATHTTVIRDGEMQSIPSTGLVAGDVIALGEGDAVGADCRLVDVAALQIIEAALTGESEPATKQAEPVGADAELVDRRDMAYKGTAVARGRARGIVVATGMDTEIGRIATMLHGAAPDRTPLQKQLDWLGRALGIVVIVLAAIVVAAILMTSETGSMGAFVDALFIGVSLAVAAVPEGLPAILTVVLALGVQRMAARHAVVKKLSSVETLGSASVICTDKTGTLTRNEMTIVKVVTPSAEMDITGSGYQPVGELLHDGRPVTDRTLLDEVTLILGGGSLANDATLRDDGGDGWEVIGDPTEVAFLVAERKLGLEHLRSNRFSRVAEVPFDSDRKRMTTVNRDAHAGDDDSPFVIVAKGAPDVLLDRCTQIRTGGAVTDLDDQARAGISDSVERLADGALRTLAVAYRPVDEAHGLSDEELERDLIHLGVVGIIDPPRPEAQQAIEEAHDAGIRVMMITGDHPRTAVRIGEQLGIAGGELTAGTGRELSEAADDEFGAMVHEHSVFARVAPEHKLRIVETLQDDGEIVAMTGDGVNDAPALRQADIGVAMGINGTEVSKEASDMILADDNFATILRAVREGREIFANIQKFIRYLLASNAGEVLVMFLGVVFAGVLGLTVASEDGSLAVPLLATQILWINLLTDSAMALALGVDPSVEKVMAKPPRALGERVVDRPMISTIVVVGVTAALAGLIALDLELEGGMLGGSGDIETARTMTFTTIVLAQIFNAFNSRSSTVSAFVHPFANRMLLLAILATILLQVAVVHLPGLSKAFDTEPLDLTQWMTCAALASLVLWAEELHKVVERRLVVRR